MHSLREARLIPYELRPCRENMAADEYLISYCSETGRPVIRLYGWSPPAISIGRYQDAGVLHIERCIKDKVGIVRRITGGGAIFHDNELTYSVIISEKDIGRRNLSVNESFETLNVFIIGMYRSLGLSASYSKNIFCGRKHGTPSEFCFSGNEEYDIIINNKKIGGNAQRRTGDIILQHGSIPIDINAEKIAEYFRAGIDFENFISLKELLTRKISAEEISNILISSFINYTGLDIKLENFSASEKILIDKLVNDKYAGDQWNIDGRAE